MAGLNGQPCTLCPVRNVKCISGFDIRERVTDIARLKEVPGEFLIG